MMTKKFTARMLLDLPVTETAVQPETIKRVQSRTELEDKLQVILNSLLKREAISMDENFFNLGMDSLKAVNFIAKIHQEMKVQVLLVDIFKRSTIEELACFIAETGESIYTSIKPAETRDAYPLSSAQKRMYVFHQLDETSLMYNLPIVLVLEGTLERERLERAFQSLILRHESLRTGFELRDQGPVQIIYPEVQFTIEDLQAEGTIDGTIERFIRPFDLCKPPILRAGLLPVAEKKYILIVDTHHIASDGVSGGILVQEFVRLYNQRELSALRLQYKDYALWQEEIASTDKLKKQEQYWLDQFRGEIPTLNLDSDFPRPVVRNFEGGVVSGRIDQVLTEKLCRLANEHQATLFMVLLGAYYTLLHRYTGQKDIIVGTVVAGRPHADLETVIGMFVNTLPLRNYPYGQKRFSDFLVEIKQNTLQSFDNQDYQFEELIEKLNLPRDMGRNPLFDTLFAMFNVDPQEGEITGLKVAPYPFRSHTAQFDIVFNAAHFETGVVLELEYAVKLFKAETMGRFLADYCKIIESIASNPEIRLGETPIFTEEEKRRILAEVRKNHATVAVTDTAEQLEAEFDF